MFVVSKFPSTSVSAFELKRQSMQYGKQECLAKFKLVAEQIHRVRSRI